MEPTNYSSSAVSPSGGKWYYMSGGAKCGPVDASKLASMLASGELDPETRVWTRGMEKWSPASATNIMDYANGPKQSPVVVSFNPAEQPAPKRKSRWWIWLIVGILVVGVVAAVCFFLFAPKDAPEVSEEAPAEVAAVSYGLDNPVVFENEQCAFIIDEIGEKGDYLELDVRCVNKTADMLSFSWASTCINGSMFDPLWNVYVQGNSTMKSSITFPLSTLESYNLLPADEIKFVLSVYNEDQFNKLFKESSKYILYYADIWDADAAMLYNGYKRIEGYDDYLFANTVRVDKDKRPYYVSADKTNIYFDEIYGFDGEQVYSSGSDRSFYDFYNDSFGRPYYFNEYGNTVYYDGYGYAFYDEVSGKNYFYDENGQPAYYANGGIPEYYEGTVTQEMLDAGKPESLTKANGSHIVHKEFSIYPTGKDAGEVTYPNRVSTSTEQVYWKGEKGSFIILGGKMDEFKGYMVYTYVENKSDSYIYFAWEDVVVNGVNIEPSSVTVLRPHSSSYRDIIIPAEDLEDNQIKNVEEIDFRVYAVGENLSVPLYPIDWDAVTLAGLSKGE